MATTGQNIIDEVREALNDEDSDNYRWSDAALLRYLNAGQRRIVTLVPEANVIEEKVSIAAASDSRQTLPTGGVKFIKVTNNWDTTNNVRGPALRYVELDAMDTHFPEWQYSQATLGAPLLSATYANAYFTGYAHDPREPKVYYLLPRPSAATAFSIMLVYSKLPTDLAALSSNLSLTDEYRDALVEYVTYRAEAKDGRFSAALPQRQERWNNFLRALGLKTESDQRVGPQHNKPPEGP